MSPFRLAVASAFAQTEVEATGRRKGRALLLSPSFWSRGWRGTLLLLGLGSLLIVSLLIAEIVSTAGRG